MNDVPDDVFGSGAMGKGYAVEPDGNNVVAPFDGTVVMVAPTKHAIGLRSNSGIELLIHVGLDTVTLDGKPFTVHVKDGDPFKAGDVLTTFDRDMIVAHNISTITPVIVTNSATYADVLVQSNEKTDTTQAMLTVVNN